MNERINYIDHIKAFAILLVVTGHAISSIWGDEYGCNNFLYKFIYSFHMPLFMFISGYVVYKPNKNKSTNELLSKTSYLLYPYIIWAIIDSLIYHNSVYNHVISKVHGGLWFLLCLYEIFLLIYLLEIISSSFNKSCKFWKDIFIFGVPACILIITNKFIYQTDIAIYLNFDMLAIHYKYFIVGYLTRKYIKLHNLFDSDIFAFISFLTFLAGLYIICNPSLQMVNFITITITSLSATLYIFYFFKRISIPIIISKILSYIGKRTLYIYILHSLFFYGLSGIKTYLYAIKNNLLLVLMISLILSITNIMLCIIFSNVINKNRFISMFLLGKQK